MLSKHSVAWQPRHLPNPAGNQSAPANMQHNGAYVEKDLEVKIRHRLGQKTTAFLKHEKKIFNSLWVTLEYNKFNSGNTNPLYVNYITVNEQTSILLEVVVVVVHNTRYQFYVNFRPLTPHPLRLLRMEAIPMTMLARDRALAAFLRANSLSWTQLARSLRNSLLVLWKKPETKQG